MNYLKKLSLAFALIAFCLSLSVATGYAQPGRAGWKNNNGKAKGWYKGQRNGWDNGRKRGWRNRSAIFTQQDRWRNRRYVNRSYVYPQYNYYSYPQYRTRRYGRITTQEYWRLRRQRARLYNTRNRYNNDGYISNRERRTLQNRYTRYRRSVYRDRRDW